jgi:hypothetical protein
MRIPDRMRLMRALGRFWEHDPGLSIILVALLLFAFVLPPVLLPGVEHSLLVDLLLTLLLVAGVASLRARRDVRALLAASALAALAVRAWPVAGPAAAMAATLASLGLMTLVVLAQTFRGGPVSVHRVQGAVAAYLLLGMTWAAAYALVALLVPSAFASARPEGLVDRSFLYFSFSTLTTVGYGDIAPVHRAARSLAMVEALTGQLYPAIFIARIVTLHGQRERTRSAR